MLNTISIRLEPNTGFTGSITISGLTGTATADDSALAVTSSSNAIAQTGIWSQSGTLVVAGTGMVPGGVYNFSFTLKNPTAPQESPIIQIEGYGSPCPCPLAPKP